MKTLESMLTEQLTQPRELIVPVLQHIEVHYNVSEAALDVFFADVLPKLEEYELDLVFSPLFTPTFEERIALLGTLPPETVLAASTESALVQNLTTAQLTARLFFADRQYTMPLQEVSIERFVRLMNLTIPFPVSVLPVLSAIAPANELPTLYTLLRDTVWQPASHQALLKTLLEAMQAQKTYRLERFTFLTDFVRSYRPETLFQLTCQLKALIESCETDLANINTRLYHDDHIRDNYAYDSEQKTGEDRARENYKRLKAESEAFLSDIATLQVH